MKTIRSGFTLLEALVALSLVTVLMAVSWSMFATFSRLENRARKTVAGLEITRSLRRQMQNDLDQLANPANKSDSATSSATFDLVPSNPLAEVLVAPTQPSPLAPENSTIEEGNSMTPDRLAPSAAFLDGSSQSLKFMIRKKGNESSFSGGDQFFVVTYEWRDSKTESDSSSILDTADNELDLDEFEGMEPLSNQREFVRSIMTYQDYESINANRIGDPEDPLEFETIEIGRGQENNETEQKPIQEQIDWLPEISKIEFKYFDGKSWSSNWSADSLPVAIEVIFSVRSPIEPESESNFEESTLDDELDFESEIEIGDSEKQLDDELMDDEERRSGSIPDDFDPESKRFLIHLGTQYASSSNSDDRDSEAAEAFSGEGGR